MWPLSAAASACRRHAGQSDPNQPVRQEARVLPSGHALPRPEPVEQVLARLLVGCRQVFIDVCRVCSVSSNVPAARSFSDVRTSVRLHSRCGQHHHRIAIRSHPRSLLSMARLNSASSRTLRSIWSLVRMARHAFAVGAVSVRSVCLCSGNPLRRGYGRDFVLVHGLTPPLFTVNNHARSARVSLSG